MPVVRRAFTQQSFQGNAKITKGLNIGNFMARGAVPKELLGLTDQGGFSGIAHSGQTLKRIDNLINNGVDDEIIMSFSTRDKDGNIVNKTTPFMWNGKMMRPNDKGHVRISDKGKLDLTKKISNYRRVRTNEIMNYVRDGDEIAAYIFGLDLDEWEAMCSPSADGLPPEIVMSDELKSLDCTIQHINSLPPSLTQTQCVAKLRKIVEYFEKNVNIEDLSSVSDIMGNMKDGHNVFNKLSDNHPFQQEAQMIAQRTNDNAHDSVTIE